MKVDFKRQRKSVCVRERDRELQKKYVEDWWCYLFKDNTRNVKE